jgi:hypothetical protein
VTESVVQVVSRLFTPGGLLIRVAAWSPVCGLLAGCTKARLYRLRPLSKTFTGRWRLYRMIVPPSVDPINGRKALAGINPAGGLLR